MESRILCLTGYVLAGGASRRMGRPKPQLVFGDETLLERQLRLLRAVSHLVGVIGACALDKVCEVAVLPDELPDRGPLGGIYTGLLRAHTEFSLFLGCDLPFMESRFLRFLAKRAIETQADVTVPESRDRMLQPLVAIYRRRILPIIRSALESGQNKVDRFFARVETFVVPWREIARAGFASRIFANMNTQEDYEAAVKRLACRSFPTSD